MRRDPRTLTIVLALGGAGLCCAPASGQDARERMTRMAEGAAAAAPAVEVRIDEAEAASPSLPPEASPETRPLAPRTTPASESEALPSAGSGGGGAGGWVLPTLAGLGVVLGILYGLKALAARLGGFTPARPSASVEVLSRTSVGPKSQVLLVRVAGKVLVVGDSAAGGLRTLDAIEGEAEVAELLRSTQAPAGPGADFASLLTSLGKKPGAEPVDPAEPTPDPLAGVKARLQRMGGGA